MNTLTTPVHVIREVARRLTNTLRFSNNVNRDYDNQFASSGGKIGDTCKLRLPQRFQVTKGAQRVATPVEDRTVDITLTDQAQISIEFGAQSLTLEVEDYRKRYVDPAVEALANTVDYDGLLRMYQKTFMCVGTPGVIPGSTGTLPQAAGIVYQGAVVKLMKGSVPTPYTAMLDPNMHAYLTSAYQAVFNPAAAISAQYKTGQFKDEALGIQKWFQTQNIATHVVGALGTVPLANSATVQTGASIILDGASASITGYFKKGDVITFDGTYAINPMNYTSTGQLAQFTVTADTDSDGSGNVTVPIYPSIVTTGPNQNVSAGVANNAPVKTFGHASSYAGVASPQGLVYHQDAYALVFADLVKPEGVWVSERISNKALGIAVRFVKDYNIDSDQSPARLDVLYGWAATRPELACRIAS